MGVLIIELLEEASCIHANAMAHLRSPAQLESEAIWGNGHLLGLPRSADRVQPSCWVRAFYCSAAAHELTRHQACSMRKIISAAPEQCTTRMACGLPVSQVPVSPSYALAQQLQHLTPTRPLHLGPASSCSLPVSRQRSVCVGPQRCALASWSRLSGR